MNAFLLTCMLIGSWNLIVFVIRVAYSKPYWYTYHIFIGLWATWIYFHAA